MLLKEIVHSNLRKVVPTQKRISDEAKSLALNNTCITTRDSLHSHKRHHSAQRLKYRLASTLIELHSKLYIKSTQQKNKIRKLDSLPYKMTLEKWLLYDKKVIIK
jgi:hypothetical protein